MKYLLITLAIWFIPASVYCSTMNCVNIGNRFQCTTDDAQERLEQQLERNDAIVQKMEDDSEKWQRQLRQDEENDDE